MEEELVKIWPGVPDGSKLVVVVEGTGGGKFLVALLEGFVRPPPEGDEIVPVIIDTANGVPTEFAIESPRRYSLDIDLDYRTDATAKVNARVLDKDGNIFLDPLVTEVTRKKGQLEKVLLTIGTAAARARKPAKAKASSKPRKARKAK